MNVNVNVSLMIENVIQVKSGIMINVNVSAKNGKYLAGITGDSVITCDEIIDVEETTTLPKNFNEKNITCKT